MAHIEVEDLEDVNVSVGDVELWLENVYNELKFLIEPPPAQFPTEEEFNVGVVPEKRLELIEKFFKLDPRHSIAEAGTKRKASDGLLSDVLERIFEILKENEFSETLEALRGDPELHTDAALAKESNPWTLALVFAATNPSSLWVSEEEEDAFPFVDGKEFADFMKKLLTGSIEFSPKV